MPDILSSFLSAALGAISLLLSVPTLVLLAEVVASARPEKAQRHNNSSPGRRSVSILVPAHNEGDQILPTLTDILTEIAPGDRVLVVADNCTDDTAALARMAGAEAIERQDATKRGKGYALDFGIRHLAEKPPEIVIMIDADCRLGNGAVDILAARASETGRPIQALYLMSAPKNSLLNDRVSEFTWRLKNWVRPLGLARLDLPCQLMGTGMAFPWGILNSVGVASGELTEDLKLGLDLARAGHPPLFCPSALVTSSFATSIEGRKTQQQRWEQGHRELIWSMAPKIFRTAFVNRDWRLLAMGLDLTVPPIFLLALVLGAQIMLTAAAAALGLSIIPFFISLLSVLALTASMVIAWIRHGRDILPPRSLLSILPYAFAKLKHSAGVLMGKRAKTWVRTDRK